MSCPLELHEEAIAALCAALETSTSPPRGASRRIGVLWHKPPREILELRATLPAPSPVPAASATGSTPRLRCERAGELPAQARQLLDAEQPFVLRDHGLWPAAEAHWGQRDYLEHELDGVSCAVLSAPSRLRSFAYWMPPRRHKTLTEALAKGQDRVLAPYAFDEPDVSQLNLDIAAFFALSDGR